MPHNLTSNETKGARARLKIGLIVDSEFASKYVYELAEWAQSQPDLVVSHLVIHEKQFLTQRSVESVLDAIRRHGLLDIARRASFALITKFESIRLKKFRKHRNHCDRFSLSTLVPQSIRITPIISKSGFVYRHTDEDIAKIKDINLDVLVRCGAGILRGKILNSSRFGILSFHHGDNRINRGIPAAFWEINYRQTETGFVIQQLTEELDGGNVLVRGSFRTRSSYLLNQAILYTKSNFYMKKLLSDIARTQQLPPFFEPRPYCYPLFKVPTLLVQCNYVLSLGLAAAKKTIDAFFVRRNNRWTVAYINSDWKQLVMWRAKKIPNPPNRFLADPFVISEGCRDYCFVEDYDPTTGKGCIAVYELTDTTSERLGAALVEPFHLSFPFLFRFDSKIYMCPETAGSGQIRVYECVDFPLGWKLSRILMSNVSAVDSMLFERDGLWWLLTNIDPTNIDEHCSELFAFCAESPLSDNWCAHPKNPLFIDSAKGRNAGILYDKDSIYRVAQRQGFSMYGTGFSINRIEVLNKDDYVESELCLIEPRFFPRLIGCHHMHSNGRFAVFDFLGGSAPT